MLKPSHREKRFTAKRVFTGREDACKVFGAACDQTDTNEIYQVLMWYGVGGQGKSALLREFGRILVTRNETAAKARLQRRLAFAKVDFDDERLKRIDSALYSLRLQLGQYCRFPFHTFDAAFVSYYKKTRPGIDVMSEFPELFIGEKEGLADLLDVLDDHLPLVTDLASVALPGANLIYKWGVRLTGRLKTWWSTRGSKVLAGIEQLTPDEILLKLPSYLGIDLCDGIAARPSIRPVIFLDTYEALWRERGQRDALADRRTDAWVRLLVQDAPGVLFVIAGRDKLRWNEIDSAWEEVVESRLLGGLSSEDADRFLQAVPISEDDIRARIIATSEGLPFYLDLQVSQYEVIRERADVPAVEQFGGKPSEILSRFLEHLNETDQALLRLASYVNLITRPAMTDLADAFPHRATNFSFDRMVARSAFTPVAGDAYTIHALMQEELQRRERDENEGQFRKIHRHLFDYYNRWLLDLTDEQERNGDVIKDAHLRFEMAFNHILAAAKDEAVSWLLKYQHWIAGHDAWELVEKLHRRAVAVMEDSRSSSDPELLFALNNLAAAIEKQNRSEEALPVLQRLLQVAANQALLNPRLLSTAHFNLGQLLRDEKNYALAEGHYRAAIDLCLSETARHHFSLFVANAGLGECLYLQGRYDEAISKFQNAVIHALQTKSSDTFAMALHLLAEGYQAMGDYEKAIPLFQFSLAKLEIVDTRESGQSKVDTSLVSAMTGNIIWRSHLSARHFDRNYIKGEISIFRELKETSWWLFERQDLPKVFDIAEIDLCSVNFIYKVWPKPRDLETKSDLHRFFLAADGNSVGSILRRVVESYVYSIKIYRWDCYDFGIDKINKVVWLSIPEYSDKLIAYEPVFFVIWSRQLDFQLMDFQANSTDSNIDLATFLHAKSLDVWCQIAKFINDCEIDRQNIIKSILNDAMIELVEAKKLDKSSEELFGIYAQGSRAFKNNNFCT